MYTPEMDDERNVTALPVSPAELLTLMAERPMPAVEAGELLGVLREAVNRAGWDAAAFIRLGAKLLQGFPRSVAVIGSGMTAMKLASILRDDHELREMVASIEEAGFQSVYVVEAMRRALDPKDRGSARLLELLLKQRDPSFRDKFQVEHTLLQGAEASRAKVIEGVARPVGAGQFGAAKPSE